MNRAFRSCALEVELRSRVRRKRTTEHERGGWFIFGSRLVELEANVRKKVSNVKVRGLCNA
jgi:hypothetical protein